MPDLTKKIAEKLKLISLDCTDSQIELFNNYINLLDKWNKAYNLSAIRNINEMLDRHLIDSLSIAQFIQGKRFIDVGTGPGLPGIPLAILYPDRHFSLLDSNGKKTRFLMQAKMELGLKNIEVYNERVEKLEVDMPFDAVISRAFASLEDMIQGADHLCAENGHFYAMKGLYPELELQAITKPYKVQAIRWEGNQPERHLVIISQLATAAVDSSIADQ